MPIMITRVSLPMFAPGFCCLRCKVRVSVCLSHLICADFASVKLPRNQRPPADIGLKSPESCPRDKISSLSRGYCIRFRSRMRNHSDLPSSLVLCVQSKVQLEVWQSFVPLASTSTELSQQDVVEPHRHVLNSFDII